MAKMTELYRNQRSCEKGREAQWLRGLGKGVGVRGARTFVIGSHFELGALAC